MFTAISLQAVVTLFMTGLIWFVQVVHYPLLSRVGEANFVDYEIRHRRLTTWVVALPMLIEAACAALLVWPVQGIRTPIAAWFGLGLVFVIWASTAILLVPCRETLSRNPVTPV